MTSRILSDYMSIGDTMLLGRIMKISQPQFTYNTSNTIVTLQLRYKTIRCRSSHSSSAFDINPFNDDMDKILIPVKLRVPDYTLHLIVITDELSSDRTIIVRRCLQDSTWLTINTSSLLHDYNELDRRVLISSNGYYVEVDEKRRQILYHILAPDRSHIKISTMERCRLIIENNSNNEYITQSWADEYCTDNMKYAMNVIKNYNHIMLEKIHRTIDEVDDWRYNRYL